ncbi:ABC transporter permease [Schumannella luteola]|jgi:peptide/nickel transport system permease protein
MKAAFTRLWAFYLGVGILALFLLLAAFPDFFAPYGEQEVVGAPFLPPGGGMLLGTDEIGRDLLTRLIFASRHELLVALGGALAAGIIGSVWGLVASLWGGVVEWVSLRVIEIVLAVPMLVLALFLITVWGRATIIQLVALTVVMIPVVVRIARDAGRLLVARAYVEASLVGGASRWRVLRRHLLPNALPTLVVAMTVVALSSLVVAASLAYLGLGASPSDASWGNMLRASFGVVYTSPTMGLLAGGCVILVGASFSLIGSGLGAVVEVGGFAPRLKRSAS